MGPEEMSRISHKKTYRVSLIGYNIQGVREWTAIILGGWTQINKKFLHNIGPKFIEYYHINFKILTIKCGLLFLYTPTYKNSTPLENLGGHYYKIYSIHQSVNQIKFF